MKKTFFGIALFLVQLALALYYNRTIDLIVVAVLAGFVCTALVGKFFRER